MNTGRFGVSDDHVALHEAARGWTDRHQLLASARACLDGAPAGAELPPWWEGLVDMGWPSLHLDHGLVELGVVLEELGRSCAPGPFLPSVVASAILARLGGADDLVAALGAGELTAAVAWDVEPGRRDAGGSVSGRWPAVPTAATAGLVLVPIEGGRWAVLDGHQLRVEPRPSVDDTRRVADVVAEGVPAMAIVDDPAGIGVLLATRLWCAEAVGVAAWCVDTAALYATVREQFGQPIGKFQAVKHRCADLLLTLERARAATWDSLRCTAGDDEEHLVTAAAAALAPEAAVDAAKGCIQVLGGIGFTWEHDAHLFLRRALGTRAIVGSAARWRRRVVALAGAGARRTLTVDLPPEADAMRTEVRAAAAEAKATDKADQRRVLADGGWIAPHWPSPWGRGAGAIEQLVIDEEFALAQVRRPHLAVGAWVLPTLIAHGTPEQQERWIPPTLRGELSWCQLFSEPGAGSDLASLATKASRTDGGWLLTGQKVWTTMAAESEWGLCLARTDTTVPRHEGISAFCVDMSADGIDIRPLRELTGLAMFNEVFLSDVFVPDDCVVGPVGGGWKAARTTLANERVSMGSGSSFGLGVEMVLGLLGDPDRDPVATDAVGSLLADAQALAVLGLRLTARALSGAEPGPEASVRKLLGVEHEQRAQEVGLSLLGRAALADDGDASGWIYGFLANRCLSIAGGTSEIQRNVIAERLLGLPRDH